MTRLCRKYTHGPNATSSGRGLFGNGHQRPPLRRLRCPLGDLSDSRPAATVRRALRGQLGLKLLDSPDADAVKLRELDDANAGLEVGDDGRSLVGWNGRADCRWQI